jgi:hypothetical protein
MDDVDTDVLCPEAATILQTLIAPTPHYTDEDENDLTPDNTASIANERVIAARPRSPWVLHRAFLVGTGVGVCLWIALCIWVFVGGLRINYYVLLGAVLPVLFIIGVVQLSIVVMVLQSNDVSLQMGS